MSERLTVKEASNRRKEIMLEWMQIHAVGKKNAKLTKEISAGVQIPVHLQQSILSLDRATAQCLKSLLLEGHVRATYRDAVVQRPATAFQGRHTFDTRKVQRLQAWYVPSANAKTGSDITDNQEAA